MKTFVTITFILISTFVFSQNNFRVIKKVESSKLSRGSISGIPITLYLVKKENISYCDLYDTFIEGWYYYDKYKIKIPLHGFSKDCEIKVYNFNKTHPVTKKDASDTEIEEIYKNSKYNELLKFSVCESENKIKGVFTKNNKSSTILMNAEEIIGSENEFFTLPNSKTINLGDVFSGYNGNKFISLKQDKNENRILFYFEYPSNRNACRMCGASEGEKGYRIIYFDKNWRIKNKEEYLIESCLQNTYSTKIKNKSKNSISYSIKKDTEENFLHFLNINKTNSTIKISK